MTKGRISRRPTSNEKTGAFASGRWKRHGHLCFIILTSVVFGATAVAGPRISKVRTGEHKDFDRLVFELEGPAQVGDPQFSSGRIWVPFLNTETALANTQFVEGAIRSVEFRREGQTLNAEVEVALDLFEISLFALSDPARIVLDVFTQRQASALTASEKDEAEPTESRLSLPIEDERVNSRGVELGTTAESGLENSTGAVDGDLRSFETRSTEAGSLETKSFQAESGKVLSAGFDWTLAGLVALGLFLVGLLSIACVKVLKKPEANLEKSRPNEDFKKNVAEIDALIRKSILNYERLKLRKQE